MGKQGEEKYRTQNLPNTCCPGLYELGVAILVPRPGRKSRKLSSSSVVVVYVGQSENVRARTQQYGRNGAHLENGVLNDEIITNSPSISSPRLFSDIFSKGFTIVYRWAPMNSKRDAEKIEDELLRKYDYAWNKRRNGDRRSDDIHKKLESYVRKSQFSILNTLLQYLHQIKTCDLFISRNQNDSATHFNSKGDFGIRKSRPRQVGHGSNEHSTSICGAATVHGSVCTKPHVDGRKRCAEHKGMKINSLVSKFRREEKAHKPSNAFECPMNEKFGSKLWSYLEKWFSL